VQECPSYNSIIYHGDNLVCEWFETRVHYASSSSRKYFRVTLPAIDNETSDEHHTLLSITHGSSTSYFTPRLDFPTSLRSYGSYCTIGHSRYLLQINVLSDLLRSLSVFTLVFAGPLQTCLVADFYPALATRPLPRFALTNLFCSLRVG